MIRALLVDDEAAARGHLRARLLEIAPEVEILAEASNIDDGSVAIQQHAPQLVFLDVQMPGGNGFQLLERLGKWDFDVIFTTAFQRFAIQAIRFSALDYLLKPVQADELRAAVDRSLQRHGTIVPPDQQQFLHNITQRDERTMKLTVAHGDRSYAISPVDVMWCQADDNYTQLHLKDGRRFMSARTLKDYEEMLSPIGFIRVHKSAMVNREHVDGIGDGHVRLRNGVRVEISRRRMNNVVQSLRNGAP